MGIINSNKLIDTTAISCGDTLNVTLGITAAPDIVSNPTDIVLILDRSGSMSGQPIADLKTAVDTFIDIIASATGGAPDEIGSGSHIGIVSFSDTAIQNTALITSVADLKAATAALSAGGLTNHSDAFAEATDLLSTSANNRVMVMFTDGVTTTGPDPSPVAAAARAQGITIYCIGLVGADGIDVAALNDWATDPDTTHVAVAPDSSQLEQLFADLAANISIPGATNIVIDEVINPDFIITGTPAVSAGSISQLTETSFRWTIDQLGTVSTESATATFPIQHTAAVGGTKQVNQSISYTDAEGNVVAFADPTVVVDCPPLRECVCRCVQSCFTICDLSEINCCDVYQVSTSYHDSPLGLLVKTWYGIAVRYIDCNGEQSSKNYIDQISFPHVPSGVDPLSFRVRFADLCCDRDCDGNLQARFHALLCYDTVVD